MSVAWWKSMVRWPMSLHQNFHKPQCAWKEMWQPIMDSLHKARIFHAIYTVVELNAWCLTKLLLSVTEKKQFYNNIFMPWMNKQFANQRLLLFIYIKYWDKYTYKYINISKFWMDNSFVDILKKGWYLLSKFLWSFSLLHIPIILYIY